MGQDDWSEEQVINCLKAAGADFMGDGTGGELDFFIQDQGKIVGGGSKGTYFDILKKRSEQRLN